MRSRRWPADSAQLTHLAQESFREKLLSAQRGLPRVLIEGSYGSGRPPP